MSLDGQYTFNVTKCELRGNILVERGNYFPLSLAEAVTKFSLTGDVNSKKILLRARAGSYIGTRNKDGKSTNFVIYNRTDDGDIRWLLEKIPELESSIIEVYLVNDIDRPKNTRDLA